MTVERPVVIIGAGLMGSASARALARRGVPVVVIERFALGHGNGSSHGSARIVRRGYGDALYTRLTGRAFELWHEIERSCAPPLLRMLGGLDFGPRRDVATVAALLTEAGVAHEVLPAREAAARWPGMVFDGDVVYHPQAGTLDAERAVQVMTAQAVRSGAQVHTETAAASLHSSVGGPAVRLSDGSLLQARCVVVAAGAWVAPLLAGTVDLPPISVTRQRIFHFPRLDPAAPPWPSVIHESGAHPVYHLAGGRDGGSGDDRKVAEHDGTPIPSADAPDATDLYAGADAAARARIVRYVRRWLPGLDPTPRAEASCLYTRTPSEDFVLDRIGDVVVCSPCSGHGAKFAPLVGELVADLVTGAGPVPTRFRLAAHAAGLPGAVSL